MTRRMVAVPLALLGTLGTALVAAADGPSGTGASPHVPATTAPSSTSIATVDNGQLDAGVLGAIAPIPPQTLNQGPGSSDPAVTHAAVSGSSPPPPAPCTPGSAPPPPPPRSLAATKRLYTIYPAFTRSATGGYDGSDPAFGYRQPNAIPPGGDPTQTQIGAPATAATVAGHLIGVPVVINGVAPDGSCFVGDVSFGVPFLAGDNPPAPPPPAVRETTPFAVGASLLAELMGRWRLGTIDTLPGPGNTIRTFVHIPTCAWLDSTVPQAPAHLHAVTTALSDGYTFFLVYNLTLTPGSIHWDWGDGTTSTSLTAAETPPATLPTYDASAQTWSTSCTEAHPYATASAGRTITATQTFSVAITVSWSDGITTTTEPVPCDRAAGGPCALTVGPAQGWVSGPHPVDQIEPVPFNP